MSPAIAFPFARSVDPTNMEDTRDHRVLGSFGAKFRTSDHGPVLIGGMRVPIQRGTLHPSVMWTVGVDFGFQGAARRNRSWCFLPLPPRSIPMSLGHWPVVIGAAVAAWLIGSVWYSPLLFAKAWAAAHGYPREKLVEMQKSAGKAHAGSLAAFVAMAYVLHLFFSQLGADTLATGVAWGVHAWVGLALPLGFIAYLYSDKRIATFLIDTGYQLTHLLAMGAILGAWG